MKLELLNKKIDEAIEELVMELLNKEFTLEEIDRTVLHALLKRELAEEDGFMDLGDYGFDIVDDWVFEEENKFCFAFDFSVKLDEDEDVYEDYEWKNIILCLIYKIKEVDLIFEENKHYINLNNDTIATITDIYTA